MLDVQADALTAFRGLRPTPYMLQMVQVPVMGGSGQMARRWALVWWDFCVSGARSAGIQRPDRSPVRRLGARARLQCFFESISLRQLQRSGLKRPFCLVHLPHWLTKVRSVGWVAILSEIPAYELLAACGPSLSMKSQEKVRRNVFFAKAEQKGQSAQGQQSFIPCPAGVLWANA